MTVVVLHLSRRADRPQRLGAMMGFDADEHAAHCARLLALGLYDPVAVVDTEDLDYAYEATNTVGVQWYLPAVCASARVRYCGPPEGCRSTSVGDVLYAGDKFHVVASFGFTDVTQQVAEAAAGRDGPPLAEQMTQLAQFAQKTWQGSRHADV